MNKLLFILGIVLISTQSIEARHITGGEITYTCNGLSQDGTTANITFDLLIFREFSNPEGADFDDDLELGLYKRENSNWVYVEKSQPLETVSISRLPQDFECYRFDIAADAGLYSANFNIPNDGNDYMVAYQRCCFFDNVNNLHNQGSKLFGFAPSVLISSLAISSCNDSPTFNDLPVTNFCMRKETSLDFSIIDSESDSVVFNIVKVQGAGGSNGNQSAGCDFVKPEPSECGPERFYDISYVTSFGDISPLTTNSFVELDGDGILKFDPDVPGQLAIRVMISEYRNGVLLTEMSRIATYLSTMTTSTEEDFVQNIFIYPNPNSGTVNITNELTSNIRAIQIFSADGRLLKSFNKESKVLNISNLDNGLYIAWIQKQDRKWITKKLIKH